jgi:hypothetical protein
MLALGLRLLYFSNTGIAVPVFCKYRTAAVWYFKNTAPQRYGILKKYTAPVCPKPL